MIEYRNDNFEWRDEEFEKYLDKLWDIKEVYSNGYNLLKVALIDNPTGYKISDIVGEKLIAIFPFNPNKLDSFLSIADLMISYYEKEEEYERCHTLKEIKDKMIKDKKHDSR